MEPLTIILGIGIVFFVLYLLSGVKIVQQSETMVIERLGSYARTLGPGINIIWPLIEKARSLEWRYVMEDVNGKTMVRQEERKRIDLRETVYDFPKQNVITKDNVRTEISAILYFQVVDSMRTIYEISNLPNAIEKLTQTTLRNVIGEMDLDQTLTSRDTINSKLRAVLDEAANKWGVKVNRVELQDINPPPDIREAMEKQMRAERDKRAKILTAEGEKMSKILESEGHKDAEINKAEGDKRAKILMAEGEAEAKMRIAQADALVINKIGDAIAASSEPSVRYLVATRYLESFSALAKGIETKAVFMPYEASAMLSSVASIKEIFASAGSKEV